MTKRSLHLQWIVIFLLSITRKANKQYPTLNILGIIARGTVTKNEYPPPTPNYNNVHGLCEIIVNIGNHKLKEKQMGQNERQREKMIK